MIAALSLEGAIPDASARPTVLVVEDEVLIRLLLAEALRDAGCRVVEAACAAEALSVLDASALDILITDVKMPGEVDGLELAARVRQARPGLKVIVTSGHAGPNPAQAVADAFLPKPFALEDVVRRVEILFAEP
jgi:CheY-like chemotaxis protein